MSHVLREADSLKAIATFKLIISSYNFELEAVVACLSNIFRDRYCSDMLAHNCVFNFAFLTGESLLVYLSPYGFYRQRRFSRWCVVMILAHYLDSDFSRG